MRAVASWRHQLGKAVDSNIVHFFVLVLIISNLIVLGMSTSSDLMDIHGYSIDFFNKAVLILYTVEVALRFVATGRIFFLNSWNLIDIAIIAGGFLTFGGYIQILRVFRVLWLIRLLVYIPNFRHLIDSVIRSIPGLVSVLLLLFLTIYVFGVIGTAEFGDVDPKHFGDLYSAIGTLSETILMPDLWPELYKYLSANHPLAWAYVFPVVVLVNYLLLQLVIGVLLNSLQRQYQDDQRDYHSPNIKSMITSTEVTASEKELPLEGQLLLSEFRVIKAQLKAIQKENAHLKQELLSSKPHDR